MQYVISHSTIAAALYVTDPEGNTKTCYYMAEDKPVQEGVAGSEAMAQERFKRYPMEVQAAVNRQFGQVFSLPIERRANWVANQLPFVVEVLEEPNHAV